MMIIICWSADGLILQVEETDGPKELKLENKKFKK